MNKKLLIRYLLLCLPFMVGGVMFSYGIYNIVSSILFFAGGYIAIKNLVDYRKINKNIKIVNENKNISFDVDNELEIDDNKIGISKCDEVSKRVDVVRRDNLYRGDDSVPGLKRTRRYTRVRRRY